MKLIWTELAVEKLEEFADYIALDKPLAELTGYVALRINIVKGGRNDRKR